MRQKCKRFEANKWLTHLIEPEKPLYETIKGQWHNDYFCNKHPITLEIGCGHGDCTIGLARTFPVSNFIGIDSKGDRLWKGAQTAQAEKLTHVAFLRIQVEQLLDFFEADEVAEIWITFPDPRPKNRDQKRRLTSLRFLKLYKHILSAGGKVHLKTDSMELFSYTLALLRSEKINLLAHTTDLYSSPYGNDHLAIQTTYEKKFLLQGSQIKYLCFAFQ